MKPPMHDPFTLRQPKLVKTIHTVVAGNTLGGIANLYGTTTQAIMTENGMSSTTISIGQKLTIPGTGKIVKDDQGFPEMAEIAVIGRVTEESTMVKDQRGQEVQATFTICLPPNVTPNMGDEIVTNGQKVTILKRIARKSYSGRKIFYWVTNCG